MTALMTPVMIVCTTGGIFKNNRESKKNLIHELHSLLQATNVELTLGSIHIFARYLLPFCNLVKEAPLSARAPLPSVVLVDNSSAQKER